MFFDHSFDHSPTDPLECPATEKNVVLIEKVHILTLYCF